MPSGPAINMGIAIENELKKQLARALEVASAKESDQEHNPVVEQWQETN